MVNGSDFFLSIIGPAYPSKLVLLSDLANYRYNPLPFMQGAG